MSRLEKEDLKKRRLETKRAKTCSDFIQNVSKLAQTLFETCQDLLRLDSKRLKTCSELIQTCQDLLRPAPKGLEDLKKKTFKKSDLKKT